MFRRFCSINLVFMITVFLFGFQASYAQENQENTLSRFGRRHLKEATLVAVVVVENIYHVGMGVDVVKVRLRETLLSRMRATLKKRKEHLVLAHKDEFTKGTELLLALKPFGSSDRLVTIYRLSHLDKHYKDKIRLFKEYTRIEAIPDKKRGLKEFVGVVLNMLRDESTWIKWFTLGELEVLIIDKKWKFTSGDVDFLQSVEENEDIPGIKKSLARIRELMAKIAVDGPPLVGEPKKEKGDKPQQ